MGEPMSGQDEACKSLPKDDLEDDDAADEADWISLEYDLIEDVASELEEFVRLNHVRRFVEAEELYQNCLVNHKDWFPVVAEFAEHLLLRQSYEKLAHFSRTNLGTVTDSCERLVLVLMEAVANIYLKNSFQDAIAQASIIWHYLPIDYSKNMPIDTEIHILELLLQIAVLTERYRDRLLINLEPLPQVLRETEWEFFKSWSHRLFDHGYYWEAHRIFRWLLEVLPLSEAKALIKSNLEAVQQMENRSEALETAISASLQVFMQHLEGVGSPDCSEWNEFVTRAIFGHFSAHDDNDSMFESDNAVLEQLQDIIQYQLPLINNQKHDAESHILFEYKTFDLEPGLIDLTEASNLSSHNENFDATFRAAAKEGHVLLVKLLSKNKELLESKDLFQQTPLHLAAANGHEEIIRIMVDEGANIECEDWFRRTPLSVAAKNGHYSVVQLLLENITSDDFKQQKLWSMALHYAVDNERDALVRALLANNRANTKIPPEVLILAVRRGHGHMVRLLLEVGIGLNINAQDIWGWTPLMSALHDGHDAIIELLIENGAHQSSYRPDYKYENDQTPLLYATNQGHDELVNILLKRDAWESDSQREQKHSSLSMAITTARESRAKTISVYGATKGNDKDYEGRKTVSNAAGNRITEIEQALIEYKDIQVNTNDIEGVMGRPCDDQSFSRMGMKYGGDRPKIIIGIDYGTTYSGVSYVTSDKSNVEDINIISAWPGPGKDVAGTWKTPTRIAYRTENPQLNSNKWGFEVGPKLRSYSWTKLLLDRHAEMGDFDDPALKDLAGTGLMRLPDHRDAQGVCQDFLSEIYTYTVTLLRKQITLETFDVTPMECWITLPAIWSDQAKHATLSAAKAAGFGSRPMDVISTIAEPEAAAIATLKKYIGPKSLNSVKPGEHILICDCGGGTVDVTTYTINKTTPRMEFSELCVGVGGKCGATYIDRNLHQLMARRFGSSFNDLPFGTKGPGSRFMQTFEGIKRDFGYSDDETVKEIGPINLRLEDSEYYDSDERMVKLTKQDMQSLFQPVVEEILGLVSQQVRAAKAKQAAMINRIILVGGFGDSPYLNKALAKFCEDKGGIRLMCPEHCQAAVVRGAALRGLEGTAPTIKQCRYHYGFDWAIAFRPGIDKDENAYIDYYGGKKWVKGIMNWVIKKGEEVTNSTARTIHIQRAHKSGDELIYYTDLYSSSLETPQERIEEARIKKIGRIRGDFSQFDISQFACRWNSKIATLVYDLVYQLEVRFGEEKGVLDFRMVANGKIIGKADIEYDGN